VRIEGICPILTAARAVIHTVGAGRQRICRVISPLLPVDGEWPMCTGDTGRGRGRSLLSTHRIDEK